ncbi:MAG: arylsulfatase [Planctomycetota bacterium]
MRPTRLSPTAKLQSHHRTGMERGNDFRNHTTPKDSLPVNSLSRHSFFRAALLSPVLAFILSPLPATRALGADSALGRNAEPPNIVVIMADDLGFADLGCYGGEIETPRLDELAHGGVRMSQFYNTAKCHSSRVALLSGMYCDQAGAESLSRATTFARELQHAGYFTAMTGKWHLKREPTDQGFERYFGHLSGSTNFFTGDDTFRLNGEAFNDFSEDFYTTIANTDYAIRFVDEALTAKKPFLMYVAHNAPHYPLHALEEDYRKYQGRYDVGWDVIRRARYEKQVALGLVDPNKCLLSERPSVVPAWETLSESEKKWESNRMAAYAGMVDRLDHEVGRLVDHLKDRGVFDNTLLIFVSDNGACPFERTQGRDRQPFDPKSYWCYDTGWAHVGNTPFRFYKQNSHEGGISSPAILHWPAGMKATAGSIDQQPGHLIDVMATCLDVTGRSYPSEVDGRKIDPLMGRSLLPVLAGQARPSPEYLYFQFANNRGLRQGDWKLVSYRGGPWELYNLAIDRSETNDLIADEPDRFQAMKQRWFEVAREIDRLPEKRLRPVKDKPEGGSMAVH